MLNADDMRRAMSGSKGERLLKINKKNLGTSSCDTSCSNLKLHSPSQHSSSGPVHHAACTYVHRASTAASLTVPVRTPVVRFAPGLSRRKPVHTRRIHAGFWIPFSSSRPGWVSNQPRGYRRHTPPRAPVLRLDVIAVRRRGGRR